MGGDELVFRATALRDAAFALRDAIEQGAPEAIGSALERRREAFAELMAVARAPLDGAGESLVREVLALDRELESQLRAVLEGVRAELSQIRHARAVAGRQQRRSDGPRYVSRRA